MAITLDSNADYQLEDELVLIRPLTKNDHHFLLPIALNEPETWTYSHLSAAGDEGLKTYIDAALADYGINSYNSFRINPNFQLQMH